MPASKRQRQELSSRTLESWLRPAREIGILRLDGECVMLELRRMFKETVQNPEKLNSMLIHEISLQGDTTLIRTESIHGVLRVALAEKK